VTIDPFYTSNEKVQTELKLADIPTAIYYPTPIHLQKGYGWLDYRKGDFPVSEKLSQTVLSLPMHTELSAEQQEYIVERLKATLAKWI
jgi:UDP-2-acetamido-2-deoxy-ribo-hexuluronate aminotransferase